MFRNRQPLRRYCGGALYHSEHQTQKNGKVVAVRVNDCKELDPVSDFDLDLNLRAGENLREVSTLICGASRVVDADFALEEITNKVNGEDNDEK